MESKDAKNFVLNLLMFFVIVSFTMCMCGSKFTEKFESYFFNDDECEDCEKCEYDPKVIELKKIISDWIDSRQSPWTDNLEVLNQKKKDLMNKIRMCKGSESYTIDKEFMYICTKDPKSGTYYDDHMLMHVMLHEISHVICDEIGHTKNFDDIFSQLMDESHSPTCPHQKQIYDKNKPLLDDYCGIDADDTYEIETNIQKFES